MSDPIPIHLAAEDPLSEAVLRQMLAQSGRRFAVGVCYRKHGSGYLKKTIAGFNNASKSVPFLVLTDLDRYECPPALIHDWLRVPPHPNLLFRVAVHEVECWLLADRIAFGRFLGIRDTLIPRQPDGIQDPKEFLVDLARRSVLRELRRGVVPPTHSTRKQGPDYNGQLITFVNTKWRANRATQNSPSLRRALEALRQFRPT